MGCDQVLSANCPLNPAAALLLSLEAWRIMLQTVVSPLLARAASRSITLRAATGLGRRRVQSPRAVCVHAARQWPALGQWHWS